MLLIGNSDNRIYRYDPENQVSLGSFGVAGTIVDIAVNQAANEVMVLSPTSGGSGILRYNYNTGSYIGGIALASGFGVAEKLSFTTNGELLVSYSRDVVRHNTITGAQIGSTLFYTDRRFLFNGGAVYAGGNYHLLGDSDGTYWSLDYILTTNASNALLSSVGSTTSEANHSFADSATNATGTSIMVAENQNASNIAFNRYTAVGGGLQLGTGFSVNGTGIVAQSAEWGHGNMTYGIYTISSGQLAVRSFESGLGLIGSSSVVAGFTNSTQFRGSAIIVAPEPTSVFAFGVGTMILLRRRRK